MRAVSMGPNGTNTAARFGPNVSTPYAKRKTLQLLTSLLVRQLEYHLTGTRLTERRTQKCYIHGKVGERQNRRDRGDKHRIQRPAAHHYHKRSPTHSR